MCRCAPSAKARTGSLRPHLRPTLPSMHPLAEQCTRRVPLQIKSADPAAATRLVPRLRLGGSCCLTAGQYVIIIPTAAGPFGSPCRSARALPPLALALEAMRRGPTTAERNTMLSGIPCCLRAGITSATIPCWKASSDKYARLRSLAALVTVAYARSIGSVVDCCRLFDVGLRGLRRCAVGRSCKPGFFL